MSTGDNNPRMFAETIALDAWRRPFDGTTGEADLHIDVGFMERGRVGGGEAPIRFRLSLRRAEVHVVLDSEGVIEIKRASVRRAEQPRAGEARHTTKRESRFGGGIGGSLSTTSPTMGVKAGAETIVTITDTIDQIEGVTAMTVTHWKTKRGYGFKIAGRPGSGRLRGQPWDAAIPRMRIRDTNALRKRGEPPEVRIEIHCLREDLVIEDIAFTSEQFPLWSLLNPWKRLAVEQFMKDELARAGLPCGDLSDPFTRIVMGDAMPTIET